MSFKPLTDSERRQLIEALWTNTASGGIIMPSKETSSGGTTEIVTDGEAFSAIEEVPVALD